MWVAVIMAILLSLGGYYAMVGQRSLIVENQAVVTTLATAMDQYRQAAITHCATAPADCASPGTLALTSGDFPFGAPSSKLNGQWANHVDSAGKIYIFPAKWPLQENSQVIDVDIVEGIAELSRNSMTAGHAVADAAGNLYLSVPTDVVNPAAPDFNAGAAYYTALQDPVTKNNVPGIVAGMPVWLAQ